MASNKTIRSVTTCRTCRQRKVRCSRTRPTCNQCLQGSFVCQYDPQTTRPIQTYQFVESEPVSLASESQHSGNRQHPNQRASRPGEIQFTKVAADRLSRLEARVENLREMLHTIHSNHSPVSHGGLEEAPQTTPAHSDQERATRSEPECGAYLSKQGAGKFRYIESSFWAAMSQEVGELDDIINDFTIHVAVDDSAFIPNSRTRANQKAPQDLASSSLPNPNADANSTGSPPREFSSAHQRMPSGSAAGRWFFNELPPRSQCDRLLKYYFDGCHPLVPLVHMPTFMGKYNELWLQLEQPHNLIGFSPSFSTLLVALLYAGSVVSSYGKPRDALTNDLHILTSKALRVANFPRAPTLDTLRAYMLFQCQEMREEEPLTCIAFVGLALRAANILGLHRDPSHFSKIGMIEAEERRRIWWHLVHVDVLIAIAAGLPPLIDSHSWDVREISSLREDCIENALETDNILTKSPESSTAGILAQAKLQFTVSLRRMLDKLQKGTTLSATDLSKMQHDFTELGKYLETALSMIPSSSMESSSPNDVKSCYEENPQLNKWSRLLLSLYMDQRYAILSYPLLRTPGIHVWKGLYEEIIAACMSALVKFAQISVMDEFRLFYWAWPGNHQPLHAVGFVLNYVLQSPTAPLSPRARYIVDVIFTLRSQDGARSVRPGTSATLENLPFKHGGSEAWAYLWRLRAKAWRAADLDPDLVLSREDVLTFCRDKLKLQDDDTGMQHVQSQTSSFFPGLELGTTGLGTDIQGSGFASFSYDQCYSTGLDWMDWNLNDYFETDGFHLGDHSL